MRARRARSSSSTQTAAWNDARSLALGRLRDEAVAGGRRRGGRRAPAPRAATTGPPALVEFVAIGTAVRSERYEIEDAPVLSHLSGQDFAKLVRHGFWPVGARRGLDRRLRRSRAAAQQSRRVGALLRAPEPGAARLHARHVRRPRARDGARSAAQAHALHAHGVVGVTIDRSEHRARPRCRRHDLPRPHHRAARARHRDRRGAPRRAAAGTVHRPTAETGRSHERRAGALRPHLDWPACPSTGASAWSGCATAASSPATCRSTSSCSCGPPASSRWGSSSGRRSTTSASRWGRGARTRRWTSSRRRCTTPASSR